MSEVKHINSSVSNVKYLGDATIIEPVNLYGCEIGDGSFIGPFVEIQKGVIIGKNTKIQSHSFICESVNIGDDCVISHGVMFVNDLFTSGVPAMGDEKKWCVTSIGNHVLIGTNSTVLPVSICDNVVVGAGSVVTKDIVEPGFYAGNPSKLLRKIDGE